MAKVPEKVFCQRPLINRPPMEVPVLGIQTIGKRTASLVGEGEQGP